MSFVPDDGYKTLEIEVVLVFVWVPKKANLFL